MTATNPGITLSERAAKRIAKILVGEPAGSMFRVAVNGGGCSGFQYAFDLTTEKHADDIVIEKNGVVALVDETSAEFLANSEIDYSEELIGATFRIRNPNATASCGCGTSFSV